LGNAVLQVPFGIPFFIIITMNEHDCEIPAKKVHCITFGRTQVKKVPDGTAERCSLQSELFSSSYRQYT